MADLLDGMTIAGLFIATWLIGARTFFHLAQRISYLEGKVNGKDEDNNAD